MPKATMHVDYDDHPIGAADCAVCWPGYPKPCDVITVADPGVCPGLIHASYGDESANGDYSLITQCDVCGNPE